MKKLCLFFVLVVGGFFLFANHARTLSTGVSGFSGRNGVTCSVCHYGGVIPEVVIEGPSMVAPSSTHLYSLIISGGQEVAGGLDVAVTDGILAVVAADTLLMNGEITHVAPKLVDDDGRVIFTFEWTAPITPTAVTMYGAGNSVNLNGAATGDAPAATTLTIEVVDVGDLTHKAYLPIMLK